MVFETFKMKKSKVEKCNKKCATSSPTFENAFLLSGRSRDSAFLELVRVVERAKNAFLFDQKRNKSLCWLAVCLQRCGVRKDATPEGAYCGFRPVHALHKRISTGVRDHAGKARTKHINFVGHPRLPSVLSPCGTCPRCCRRPRGA